MRNTIAIACMATALTAPPLAEAHVTLQPDEVPASGFTRLDVRVPNERDNASTTKVAVKFPPGFVFASYEAVPGWAVDVKKRKLAKPITEHGEQITEEIDTITWTGSGPKGEIGPGQFQDFGLSLGMPDRPGRALTFKSLQTYDNGEVVRWIGPEDDDEPAPRVTLTAPDGGHGASAPVAAASSAVSSNDDENGDGAPVWLAIVALAVGALGLIVGLSARRRT